MIQEKLFTFGEKRNLTGIVSIPACGTHVPERPAIIFLNAGFLHQVGPHRMTVSLCREISTRNFISFRFDLSGIGDSPSSLSRNSHDEQVYLDIKSSMDLLEKKYSVERFIVAGLCSGADNAHKITVRDKRVCGMIGMDGYAYPTSRFEINRYKSFLSSPKRITNYLLRTANILDKKQEESNLEESMEEFIPAWHLPPHEQTKAEMAEFIERKVKLLFIFAGSNIWEYNYCGQVKDMYSPLDFGDCMEEIFNIEADHTYMLIRDQKKLTTQIITWLEKHFLNTCN